MRKKMTIIMLLLIFLCSSCNKTPDTTIINNLDNEINILNSEQIQETIDMEKLIVFTLNDEQVDETIANGEITVTLHGVVNKPDSIERLCTYQAEIIDFCEYQENMTFLFGEHEGLIDKNSKHYKVVEGEYSGFLVNTSKTLEKDWISPWGYVWYTKTEDPVTEDMVSVNMSDEEAIVAADEILNQIGTTAFEFYRTEYYKEVLLITPEGTMSSNLGDTLTVYYTQKLQGIPIRTVLNIDRNDPGAEVVFEREGVLSVLISEYIFEPYEIMEEYIAYEKALEIFKEHVSSDEEYNGAVFNKVNFEYTLKKENIDGESVIYAIPCWHFYRERIPGVTVTEQDVIIDCTTGKAWVSNYYK